MTGFWAWLLSPEFGILVGFHAFVVLMVALDLRLFQRAPHAVSMIEALAWTACWVVLAFVFAWGIWKHWGWWDADHPELGAEKALEFLTGYLIEKSLSVDNLFVFLVIFRYFAVPHHLQRRVLLWGILGALVFRAALILIGAAALRIFHPLTYLFGALILYTGYKLLKPIEDIDPSRNRLLRLTRRWYPIAEDYKGPRFWVRVGSGLLKWCGNHRE
jgi:tellurite resistance protein TerC